MDDRNNINGPDHDESKEEHVDPVNLVPGAFTTFSNRDEETAAELTADDRVRTRDDADDAVNVNGAVGWVAIALSIISFFWLPIIFGAAGIIVGFVARRRNANVLGNIAIAAGAIAIVISLFSVPYR